MSDFNDIIGEAMKIAQTPEGKQLAAALAQMEGLNVQQAMDAAAAGDLSQARLLMEKLMLDPRAKQLMALLGGNHG